MIEIANISLPLDTDFSQLHVLRRSIDARKKSDVHFVVTLLEKAPKGVADEEYAAQLVAEGKQACVHVSFSPLEVPDAAASGAQGSRPVVIGFGPAGMFAALVLAKAGLRPLVLERGARMDARIEAVEAFEAGGDLDPRANIQFGEGGAGTFSDGKLTTGTKNPLNRQVLEWLVEAGAPEDILIDAKPHIGTDVLRGVVVALRKQIEALGGEVRFLSQVTGLRFADGHVSGVEVGDVTIDAEEVVIACGHSARDTFAMLRGAGLTMVRKPFSVGVRIEHPQALVDAAQYGSFAGHPALPPADYKLVEHLEDGRDVYTFCMCPGGQVVCAASEEGGVVTNGMSLRARDGGNANAALLVGVAPGDLPGDDVLEGVRFQRDIEQAAFRVALAAGGRPYQAPAQRVGAFLGTVPSAEELPYPSGDVQPSYARGTVPCDLHDVLPAFVCEALARALPLMGRKLHGFDDPRAIMTAPETRSSSPVQVMRDAAYQSNVRGLYPCGEGCGHAGGIMSAAVDGVTVALSIIRARQIEAATEALAKGEPLVLPTDTVAGVGVSVVHAETPAILYELKGRSSDKPIAWLVGSVDDLARYGRDVPDYAFDLVREGWPGALTLIVKASDAVPVAFASTEGTIALRMPAQRDVLALIDALGCPMAVTSANLSGEAAPASVCDVDERIARACAVFDPVIAPSREGRREQPSGIASAIIDCTGSEPCRLR